MDQISAAIDLPFDETDIEANFDDGDLARGRAYQRDGKLRKLSITRGGRRIDGKVSSSGRYWRGG